MALAQDFFASDVKVYNVQVRLPVGLTGLKPGMSAEVAIETDHRKAVLIIPLQAVVRVGKKNYCYVKKGPELRKTEVTPGARNDFRVEVKTGLQEGDEVLRDPLGVLRWLNPQLPPTPDGGGKEAKRPDKTLVVRSVRPVDSERAPGRWVENYGLTHQDFRMIAGLPGVTEVAPVRRFFQETRRARRAYSGIVAGATPELADVLSLPLAEGRFLTEADMEGRRNVVVLGAAVADALFPGEEPLGQGIRIHQEAYVVVGVLQDGDIGIGTITAEERDKSAFIPLSTCDARFGERIRIVRGSTRRMEEVQLSDIYLTLRSPDDLPTTRESIRGLLEDAHAKPDWQVR
jgi:hypothetical protein